MAVRLKQDLSWIYIFIVACFPFLILFLFEDADQEEE
jgi:hypothetical protein